MYVYRLSTSFGRLMPEPIIAIDERLLTEIFILQVIQGKVKENYNMDMWIKQCDRGVMSCYIAQVKSITRLSFTCAIRISLIFSCHVISGIL